MRFDAFRKNRVYLSLAIAMVLVFSGIAYQSVFGESEAAGPTSTQPMVSSADTNADTISSVISAPP